MSKVTYIIHDNGIRDFIFHEATRQALDEWFVHVEAIMQRPQDEQQYLLVDTSNTANPPLQYAYQRMAVLMQRYPNTPQMRTAFVNRSQAMNGILNAMLMLLYRELQVQYFKATERDKAIAWLLEKKKP